MGAVKIKLLMLIVGRDTKVETFAKFLLTPLPSSEKYFVPGMGIHAMGRLLLAVMFNVARKLDANQPLV